jgi:DNA repair exonuclease SbcCD ATPase subunit
MLLLEVYVQGVSRFLTPYKFSLQKGYNVVYGGNETGKTALAHAIVGTLDTTREPQARERLQPIVPQDTSAARYGLLFEHEGIRYRALRNLSGGVNLARLNAETQKFEALAKDDTGLENFYQDFLDLPLYGVYGTLALINRVLTPTGTGEGTESPRRLSSALDFAAEAALDVDLGDIESQVKVLKRELHLVTSLEELEFRVDGLQKKRFETEAKMAKLKDITAKTNDLTARQKKLEPLTAVTAEIENRLRNLERQEQYQAQKMGSLDRDIADFEKQLDVLEPKLKKRFHKDPLFATGAVIALLGFTLPFVINLYFLSLIGFAAFAFLMYLVVLAYPKLTSRYAEIDLKYKQKCQEEERAKREYDGQMSVIRELVKTLHVLDAKDLIELLDEFHRLEKSIEAQRELFDAAVAQVGDLKKLEGDLLRQDAELELFQEEMQNAGAITRDEIQIRRELERLERLRSGDAAPAGLAVAAQPAAAAASTAGTGPDIGFLLRMAAEAARQELGGFTQSVNDKMNAYLQALAPKRYGPPRLDERGALELTHASLNQPIELNRLSECARDTVLLALRLALIEVTLPHRNFPIILDDPFGNLDDQRQAVAIKLLKRLSGMTQVVHLTSQKSALALSDHRVELAG